MMENNRRAVFGFFLVVIGVLLFLKGQDFFPYRFERFFFSWPMLLIAIGLFNLLVGNRVPAIILLLVGGFFILDRIPWLNWRMDWQDFWPVLLVIAGLAFILRQRNQASQKPVSENYFDAVNIFGGSNQIISSHKLEGGKITSVFGGSDIDLRDAKPVQGAAVEIFTMFGGCNITVPPDWNVRVEVTSILGGFEDKRRTIAQDENSPRITIKGLTLLGGGEIKS